MRKEKFFFNTHTLRYERVVTPLKTKVVRIIGFVSAVVVASFVLIGLVHRYFPSGNEKALLREIEQMKYQYKQLDGQMDLMSKVLTNIQERDKGVHRTMFGMDPIDEDVWNGGTGGHDKYAHLTKYKNSSDILLSISQKSDKLAHQLAVQSMSLDTLVNLAKGREKMFASIPAITPVRSDKLDRGLSALSGFGYRIHPIYKTPRMHSGIDFTCPSGTPIQATGAGKVETVTRDGGYGLHVIIDHGYGYKTLYAHMARSDVRPGQTIVRGQKIGLVGSSGSSTGPHCHYEVILKGNKVNPIAYCMDNLTPEQYQQLSNMAAVSNQSFD